MGNFINTELLPLEVSDSPWLYENKNDGVKSVDTGKWMLFYDKSLTPSEPKQPDFKVSTEEYAVESVSKWTAGDDTNYFYEFKEQK